MAKRVKGENSSNRENSDFGKSQYKYIDLISL